MCGVGGTEFVLIIIVVLLVAGPKDLPRMLRTAGQWAGRLRRMAADLRAQSGIDDALRTEGLAEDLNEIRKLARGELDTVARAARLDDAVSRDPAGYAPAPALAPSGGYRDGFFVAREREYPRDGADAYGSLPDNSIVYVEALPKSPLARDPLYVLGDADAELPPEPEPEPVAEGEPGEGEPADGAEAEAEAAAPEAAAAEPAPPSEPGGATQPVTEGH